MSTQADFKAKDVVFEGLKSAFTVEHLGESLGKITLNLPGIHNVYNALASIAVGLELDIPFDVIRSALQTAEGVQRRLEIKGKQKGITVVDDYGHHPTEIKATLQAARECWPDKRIAVVFQPHRYTRTRALFEDFTRAFYQSDLLVVLPIYAAGEKKIEGVKSEALFEEIQRHGHKDVVYMDGLETAVSHLKKILKANDILLTLGAGDVWKVGEMLLEVL
jgi:UDP-N-acetylmuramate--alanine ligase